MTNNDIFKKLRIAFNMKDTDIIETLEKVGFSITKSEINAIFRTKEHRNYKPCGDQLLRKFLDGLIERERPSRNKI
ncbi:MAG: DUF1456 family protein [Spirochaetales bacterium]|nr:DUF1456 family protein [Spirochaetales bacterium]